MVAAPLPHAEGYSNTKELGRLLYTVYVYPFEIASVILTVAIVAAIMLTLRKQKRKTQNPAAQVKVRREDRVWRVKMEAVKKQDEVKIDEEAS